MAFSGEYITGGMFDLADLATKLGTPVNALIRMTAVHYGAFDPNLAGYLVNVFTGKLPWNHPVPKGAKLWVNPPAPAPAPALEDNPINVQLTGAQATAWADAALKALGAPVTAANEQTMTTWFLNEGVPHDLNNPLNLCTPYGGSVTSTADGDPAADHIQAYPTPADFAAAFNLEMTKGGCDANGSYQYIIADLMSGKGMIGDTSAGLKNDLMQYSGNGYNSIPAPWVHL